LGIAIPTRVNIKAARAQQPERDHAADYKKKISLDPAHIKN
jgi:hypothetical protein